MAHRFDLEGIDPLIHSPARLAIMAMLATGDELDFTLMRDRLELTDGNLSTHLRKLEDGGYVKCKKAFLGRRPRSSYRLLPKGRKAFEQHVAALDRFVRATRAD
jgi:DNA-binding MarR family transcriptional regulator